MTIIDDRLDVTASQQPGGATGTNMRVRKRNGDFEPVDVNKIVRAVAPLLPRASPASTRMRVATKTISGLYDGATTEELDELSIQTAAALIVEEPEYSRLAARLLATVHRQGGRRTRRSTRSRQSIAARPPPRPHRRRRRRASSRANARKLNDAIDAERNRALRVLRPAHGLRPLPPAPPARRARSSRRRSTSSCASPAACPRRPTRRSSFYRLFSSLEYLPSARRRCSTPARATSRCRAASCSTRPRTTSTASTSATPTSPCSRSSPAASASPTTASARAAR